MGSSARRHEPVFTLDIRTQNTRLVNGRQRQEIYALNRVMTTLENKKFSLIKSKMVGREKDDINDDAEDIFM